MQAARTAGLSYADLPRLIGLQLGDEKHVTSATSTLDVIWVLYDRVLRIDQSLAADPDRDRFLLSKGHGPMAYYAVLAAKGFLTEDERRALGRTFAARTLASRLSRGKVDGRYQGL